MNSGWAVFGDGRRVKMVVGGVTTVFAGETFEWTGSTATMKKYYYAGQRRVAMRVGSTLYYLLADHLGSTTVAAASDASLQSRQVYGPWGEVHGETGALPTSFQFTGQRKSELAGVHFFQARYYDSLAGVFLQPDSLVPDPYNPLDWNRYLYVRANPVNGTDPTGHCIDGATTVVCLAIAAGVGAVIGAGVDAYIQQKTTGQINGSEVLGAAAAGAVSAVILTIAAPASIAGAIAAGGAANVIGNQAGAFVQAIASPTANGLGADFAQNGGIYNGSTFTNLDKAAVDFAVGGAINGAFTGSAHVLSKYTNLVPDPLIKPKPSYNNAMINRLPGAYALEPTGTFAPISKTPNLTLPAGYGVQAGVMKSTGKYGLDVLQEFANQYTSRSLEPMLGQ